MDPGFRPDFQVINPNKRVRSLKLRQWLNQPRPWMSRLARTLIFSAGQRQQMQAALTRWNVGYAPRPAMSRRLNRRLRGELAPDVEQLGRMLGRDLGYWMR